jgi:hypothetical protein
MVPSEEEGRDDQYVTHSLPPELCIELLAGYHK